MQIQPEPESPHDDPSSWETSAATEIEQALRENWLLVTGVAALAVVVLSVTLLIFVPMFSAPWPWATTSVLLPSLLSFVVLILVFYGTHKQRQFAARQGHLAARAEKHRRLLLSLLNINKMIGTSTDLRTTYDVITGTCWRAYRCSQVSLMILERNTNELVVQSVAGHSPTGLRNRQMMGDGVSGWVADHQQALILGQHLDARKFINLTPRYRQPTSSMVVPVVEQGKLLGILCVTTQVSDTMYDPDDLSAVQAFAENAAVCIRYVEQRERLQQLSNV